MDFALRASPRTIIFGQGVDDHRGTFGTTIHLAKKYGGDRVFDTPLAEEAMTGVALGAALNGIYPIQTHIRVDFSLLAMNQIVNLIAKYKYMSGGALQVPLLIRMIIGRSWGQGSQHSQSLQSFFSHIPGLTVVMPASSESILESYAAAVLDYPAPVISIEHRLLYDVNFKIREIGTKSTNPFTSKTVRRGKDITIVATSIMVAESLRAADYLEEFGIDCEVIDLHCVSHPDKNKIIESVKKTGHLVVADTSWQAYGVSSEICRIICEASPSALKAPVTTLGMAPAPCPTSKTLENLFYPNQHNLIDAIARTLKGPRHLIALPDEQSTYDDYKSFRGPF
jgi:pyruvate/2-oxoglutarate/acetoin dehydrogenase E1 component